MPLVVEHLRADPKTHHANRRWELVDHYWTTDLLFAMSALIEEDGGPKMAAGSGYGIYSHRPSVDHTFTNDYSLPGGEPPIKQGDRVRMWRERAHGGLDHTQEENS